MIDPKLFETAQPVDLFPSLSAGEKDFAFLCGDIAVAIRRRREEWGLSQQEFADRLQVTQSMVSKWESGDCNFRLSTLVDICAKLSLKLSLRSEQTPAAKPAATPVHWQRSILNSKEDCPAPAWRVIGV